MRVLKSLLVFIFFSYLFLGFSVFAQEDGDSFWDEEFFQEEPLSRLEQAEDFLQQGNLKEAISNFQLIIENPLDKGEYEEALFGLATAYDRQGEGELAVRFYRTFVKKSENFEKIEEANQRIHHYQEYLLDQFHIGGWYPKLWFYEKTNALAQKYPKQEWFFKHGSYPALLVFYKFLLLLLFLFITLLLTQKSKKLPQPFNVSWGIPAIFLIYTLFLIIQFYLLFLLKPSFDKGSQAAITFDVVSILGYLILTAAVLLFLTFRGIAWRQLGFGFHRFTEQLVLTLKYLVVLSILFGIFIFLRTNGFIEKGKIFHSYPISSIGSFLYLFQFVLVVIIAPISEEIFYRGFVYPVIRNRIGVLKGIVLTSLFFSLVHVNSVVMLFFVSFFLCFIYEKNRSLIPSILVHAFYNFWVRFGGAFLPGQ